MEKKTFEFDYAGKTVTFETGRLANQADAAVTAQMGDTVVLATVTLDEPFSENLAFFPLLVDYEERYYAGGDIKGPRYTKREGRPPIESVLICRMIDRGIRPLFPDQLRNDVQVILTPFSYDGQTKPDIVGMLAACAALHISQIPFNGPVAGLRIGRVNGEFVINPTSDEIEESDIQLVTMGRGDRISMIDCDADEVMDEVMEEALLLAMETMGPMTDFMDAMREEIGDEKAPDEKLTFANEFTEEEEELVEEIKKRALSYFDMLLFEKKNHSKQERKRVLKELQNIVIEDMKDELITEERDEAAVKKQMKQLMKGFFHDFVEEQVTKRILDNDQRIDGRGLDELRHLTAEVGIYPRPHGNALFSRGETQAMTFVTLGAPGDELSMENMETDGTKRYYHHYNFPPYSVAEVKPLRGAGRREVGHGILAEKALRPVLPSREDFPYTIRVVTEILSSNGSSSMAATCGASLALMDAGVPVRKAVGGIAIGRAYDGERTKIITDIRDLEDGPGGMDFKISGTRDGVTAIQMDTKSLGLTKDVIHGAMEHGRSALARLLAVMSDAIPEPREELSEHAPRIIMVEIDPEKKGDVIGPGGKTIRNITETTNTEIDVGDDGKVWITAQGKEDADKAKDWIKRIGRKIEEGEIFEDAEVVTIKNFGAFVRLTPSKDGMLHISEINHHHVRKVTDVLKVGDKVTVKVNRVRGGKVDVSRKALLPRDKGREGGSKRERGRKKHKQNRGGRRESKGPKGKHHKGHRGHKGKKGRDKQNRGDKKQGVTEKQQRERELIEQERRERNKKAEEMRGKDLEPRSNE